MSDRRTENANTLASLLGINASDAAAQLDITVVVTVDESDTAAVRLSEMVALVLGRTVERVQLNEGYEKAAAELVIGAARGTTGAAQRVVVTSSEIRIGRDETPRPIERSAHPLLLLVASCYASSRTMTVLFGDGLHLNTTPASESLVIPLRVLVGDDSSFLWKPLQLSLTHLGGAGAIGNGVAFALSLLDVSGDLVILDSDVVSDGNLNRCLLFTAADLGAPKAVRLAAILKTRLPRLNVIGHQQTVQEYGKTLDSERWLRRLIVGVDSPRARRQLQHEIPREVFDASTTGVVEIVFHHHIQPIDTACLACIYYETPIEHAHERHIAEQLGVELADVQAHFITPSAAARIIRRYPQLKAEDLVDTAIDSLFKALCGEATLVTPEGRQVLAPFAFVSVLAASILVIELARRLSSFDDRPQFNYWRVNPWMPPLDTLKRLQPRRVDCEFCEVPALLRIARKLWT